MDEARIRKNFNQRVHKEKVRLAKTKADQILEEARNRGLEIEETSSAAASAVIREAETQASAIRKELELANARLQIDMSSLAVQQASMVKQKEELKRREQALISRELLCRRDQPSPTSCPVDVSESDRARFLARVRQRRFYAKKVAAKDGDVTARVDLDSAPNRSNRRLNSVVQELVATFCKLTANYNDSAKRGILAKLWKSKSLRGFQPMSIRSSKVELTLRSMVASLRDSLQIVKGAKRTDHYRAKYTMLQGICGKSIVKSRLHSEIARVLQLKRDNLYRASKKRALLDSDENELYPTGARNPRSDRMSDELVTIIQEWWHHNSRVSPNKKDEAHKRVGKMKYLRHPVHWLEETEVEFFLRFQEHLKSEHPELTVGLRSFQAKKPYYIRTLKDRNVCCCKVHVEMDMLRQGLHLARQNMHGKVCKCVCGACIPGISHLPARCSLLDFPLPSVRQMSESILCPKTEGQLWHKKKCVMGSCNKCGIRLLNLCKEESNEGSSRNMVKWETFQYVTLEGKKRKDQGSSSGGGGEIKSGKRLRLVTIETPVYQLVDELKVKLPAFVRHNFRQRWQSEQFQLCYKSFPRGTVLSVIDFAENYTFKVQNEIMAQHWDNKMCTILVHITYRHSPEVGSERDIITDYHFYVSDDGNHDTLFVQHCFEKHWKWMCDQKILINNHIVWSDGCAAQFKACRPFYYVARYGNWHNGVKMCWNFFGSGHGKGVHDGAGGTVKSALAKEQLKVSGGAKLRDAADAVQFLKEKFKYEKAMEYGCVQGVRRHFWLVGENEVNRRKKWDCSQVKGSRNLHCFYGFNPETTTQLYSRELSCYCLECQQGHFLSCSNIPWVGHFKLNLIEPKTPSDVAEELRLMGSGFDGKGFDHGSLSDLVRVGDNFAVEAGKPNPWGADFYLYVCTEPLHQYMGEDFEDEHGLLIYHGDWVIKGLWYEQSLGSFTSFSMKPGQKSSYVHADLVRHIRFGLRPTPNAGYYTLGASSLERIMANLKACW